MKKCPEGEYFCNDEQKCKPIPEGTHVMPNGMLMKGKKHSVDESALKDELLSKARSKHSDAKKKKFKDFMSSAMTAKNKKGKGIKATKGGKWGHYKDGKFKAD